MLKKNRSFFFYPSLIFFFICFLFFVGVFFFTKSSSIFEYTYFFLINNSFGACSFSFLVISIYSIFELLRGKDLSKILLLNILLFAVFFYFNLLSLNFFSLYSSIYAGLFPKFIHAIFINFLGTINFKPSFFSIGLEIILFCFHLVIFLFYLNFRFGKITSITQRKVTLLKENLNKIFIKIKNKFLNEFANTVNKVEIKNNSIQKNKMIQKVSSQEAQNIKENKLFLNSDQQNGIEIESYQKNETIKNNQQENQQNEKATNDENEIIIETAKENSKAIVETNSINTNSPEINPSEVNPHESNNSEDNNENDKEEKKTISKPHLKNENAKEITEDFYRRPAVLNSEQTIDDFIQEQQNKNKSLIRFDLLKENNQKSSEENKEMVYGIAKKLERTIADFGVNVKVVKISIGPVITQYELTIEKGVSLHRVTKLHSDIALALAAKSLRIIAPIPGKSVIGIEIPNPKRDLVSFRECVESETFFNSNAILPVILGKSILGEIEIGDIATTPHLLVAGATGSGKSVCINTIICSLLYRLSYHQVRFLMIDPKMVELNIYNGIPHLLSPVIVDPKKAALSLRWLISEMESRYYLLEKYGVRNIVSYNEMIVKKFSEADDSEKEKDLDTLPYIVVVIDEFADLMMLAKKEIEDSISRLAAMSRAVGIHLILATQRPSVDVITGVIKANFPSRIAFQVSSQIDSRTIIDGQGAENLLGKGDLLFKNASLRYLLRIQCSFLSDEEVQKITEELKQNTTPNYVDDIFEVGENTDKNVSFEEVEDELYQKALDIIVQDGKASASYLQRKLKIGYNRAARIIELMEKNGIVSAADGAKPRKILI